MAFYVNAIDRQARPSALKTLSNKLAALLTHIIASQNRSADVHRMQALSDDALSAMDIDRDAIVRHVYRDIYYV